MGSNRSTASPAGTEKYLSRYANPSAVALAERLQPEAPYRHVLVVPARGERAELLSGYEQAGKAAGERSGRVLVVLVVNGCGRSDDLRQNRELYEGLAAGAELVWRSQEQGGELTRHEHFDVLALDRFSEPRKLSQKEGVGTARKLGCDVAVASIRAGAVASHWLHCSDADAVLPADYFLRVDSLRKRGQEDFGCPVAALFPFAHVPSGTLTIDDATSCYEVWLRYYVQGLLWAGSPYAFPTLGSTMAIEAGAYAMVRGFSQRLAGEDYYTLDKLAKVGDVAVLDGAPIELASRVSLRVPFGTGPWVRRIIEEGEQVLRFHPADCFMLLRGLLLELEAFAEHLSFGRLEVEVDALSGDLSEILQQLGAWRAFEEAPHHATSPPQLKRRLLGWFDGLRSLRLLNALRDRRWPGSGPGREQALSQAPFIPQELSGASLHDQLEWLRKASLRRTVGLDRRLRSTPSRLTTD